MIKIKGMTKGMGIGGWLTNYKRFAMLPDHWRMPITIGDLEHFESYITERDIEYIASLGFDHVRLGFDQIVLEEEPGGFRELVIRQLHNFVYWCKKYGMRAVLNMHKAIGNYCDLQEEKALMDSEELKKRFINVWVELEKEFSMDKDVVFELLNEVVGNDSSAWNELSGRTIKAIREINAAREIILGGAMCNSMDALSDIELYDDPYIYYTFHFYDPFEFTHQQGVLQPQNLYYNRKMPWPCNDIERYRDYRRLVYGNENAYPDLDKMDKEYMYRRLEPVKEFIRQHPDKALWCGEFGTIRHCNIKYRENWMRDIISILLELDIPYCVWNYLSTPNDGNRFSLVDDDTRKVLSYELERIIRGQI